MKNSSTKQIFLLALIACSMATHTQTAVSDWLLRAKEKSKTYELNKVRALEQKTQTLLSFLKSNTDCLVKGTCPAQKLMQMRAIAAAIAATVTVVAATAITSMYAQKEEVPLAISGPSGEYQTVSRTTIARKFDIDITSNPEGPASQLLFGAETGGDQGLTIVKQYAQEVANKVLQAGIAVARIRNNDVIADYLNNLWRANELLIEKTQSGVLEKVKEVYCSLHPSQWAVNEGLNETDLKKIQYEENETRRRIFTDIANFLKNPSCAQ